MSEYCVGHLLETIVMDGKKQDILAARVFVIINKQMILIGKKKIEVYTIKIRFAEQKKYRDVEHLLTRDYTSNNLNDWIVALNKNQLLPELNRIKMKGFVIDDIVISQMMAEFV